MNNEKVLIRESKVNANQLQGFPEGKHNYPADQERFYMDSPVSFVHQIKWICDEGRNKWPLRQQIRS